MSRPKPRVLLSKTDRNTFKTEEVLESTAIWAVFFDGKPINLKTSTMASVHPGPKYKKVSFSNPGHAINCLLYTSPSPRDLVISRMPSSA